MLKALQNLKYVFVLIGAFAVGRIIPYGSFVESTGVVTLVDSIHHSYTVLIDNQTVEVFAGQGPLPKPPATIIITEPKTILNK